MTYSDGHEEDAAAREERWMVERLPDRVPAPFVICVECHLRNVNIDGQI